VRELLRNILNLYVIVIVVRIILSWFPIAPGTAMASVHNFVQALTEPVLAPIRRALPPARMGSMGFDFSPMILMVGIFILQSVIAA
jgi:YggT family protein